MANMKCYRCGFHKGSPIDFYQVDRYLFCKYCLIWIKETTNDQQLVTDITYILKYGFRT